MDTSFSILLKAFQTLKKTRGHYVRHFMIKETSRILTLKGIAPNQSLFKFQVPYFKAKCRF